MQGKQTPNTPGQQRMVSQIHHIQFSGFIFEIIVFTEQQISISFNQITSCKIHEKQDLLLQNINYKTIIAALKKQYKDIVKAQLNNAQDSYVLVVSVKYEFLPPIQQIIKFEARKVSDKQMTELQLKNYSHQIKQIKNQILKIANCQVKTAQLDGKSKQYAIDIPKEKTLLTWSIHAKTCPNVLKLNIYYFCSQKNIEKKTKLIPGDNVTVFAQNGQASVEMRFLIEPIEEFDKLIFKIQSKIEGKFHIILEKI